MQPWLLELLCCPVTGESLSLEMKRVEGDTVLEGLLRSSSGREYFISNGIPRLLPSAQVGLRTRESFGLQWQKKREGKMDSSRTCYGYDLEAQTDWICREILGEENGGGKLLLDAGCGIGDKGGPLSKRGYRVVAFDLTSAVDGARERHGESENLCFVQADALHPPFKKKNFDVTLAIGSLHHTPDAHGGFREIASLAKEKSRLAVWLYPKDRREVNPVLSKLYRIRDVLPGLQRLPARAIYAVSMAVSAALYPFCAGHFRELAPKGATPTRRDLYGAILLNTYDFLSPIYQSRHAPGEVAEWFRECGYPPPRRAGTGFFVATKGP